MGAELADPATGVNRIDVYVDESLPQEVASAFHLGRVPQRRQPELDARPLAGSVRFEPPATGSRSRSHPRRPGT